MPTLAEIAPDLAPYVTEAQAEALVTASAAGPAPAPRITSLADLTDGKRQLLLLWLKWYRAKRIPLEIEELRTLLHGKVEMVGLAKTTRWFLRHSPRDVSISLGIDQAYLAKLISQVASIRSEVARGQDAWMPVAVTPTIESVSIDVPSKGDATIIGTEFDSFGKHVTKVRLRRPDAGGVEIDQFAIVGAGGSVESTQIVIPSSLIPGGGLRTDDEVIVRADGLDSATYVVA